MRCEGRLDCAGRCSSRLFDVLLAGRALPRRPRRSARTAASAVRIRARISSVTCAQRVHVLVLDQDSRTEDQLTAPPSGARCWPRVRASRGSRADSAGSPRHCDRDRGTRLMRLRRSWTGPTSRSVTRSPVAPSAFTARRTPGMRACPRSLVRWRSVGSARCRTLRVPTRA